MKLAKKLIAPFLFRKLDWLLVKSFIGPFILTFFIALFVLVMQFLWKYVDDLVGKGLNTFVLFELIFYASARLVPLALPLAVLLSSIMTFGSLGEHFELTALKASGVSVIRMMRPLIITVSLISIFAFLFSNYLLPFSNLKFQTLLYDIRNQKPTVAIKDGIFYNDIDGFNIRIDKKDPDGNTLHGILIYDHSSGQGSDHVIYANKGELVQDEKNMSLTFNLENGNQYKDVFTKKKPDDEERYDLYFTKFKSWEKRFDLSKFKLSRSDDQYFRDLKQMMNLKQLMHEIDTVKKDREKLSATMLDNNKQYFSFTKFNTDSLSPGEGKSSLFRPFSSLDDWLLTFSIGERKAIIERATNQSRNIKNYSDILKNQIEFKNNEIIGNFIEVYRKFTLSIACLVLFFIGAPLGSIIRQGGLGWPLAYSIVFFIVYHVTSIIGEKSAEKHAMTAFMGMWLSTFLLLPLGIFLTLKAAKDSSLFNKDSYFSVFSTLLNRTKKMKNESTIG